MGNLNGKSRLFAKHSSFDGSSEDANLFSSNIKSLLSSSDASARDELSSAVKLSLSARDLSDIHMSVDCVLSALSKMALVSLQIIS